MTRVDTRAVEAHIDCRLNVLSNRGLISYAQDLLVEEPAPDWVGVVAYLSGPDILDATDLLERHLTQCCALPDSSMLRQALRRRVLDVATRLQHESETALQLSCRQLE